MPDEDLAAEARQFSWAVPVDRPSNSVQLRQAQADAARHLRNARHLGDLLERIARTLGADPLDLTEVPALVDGLRTAHDQASVRASDLDHALAKAKTGRDQAEALAGAHALAHDHLAAVTRTLVDRVAATIGPAWPVPVHGGTREALDTVRDALSRDLESYLADTAEDIRFSLTPAGEAIAAAAYAFADEMADYCSPHGVAADYARKLRERLDRAASVPHDARESKPAAATSWTSMPESWGPYDTELQTRLEPMPVAVGGLHDAGLVRSGDADRVVRDLVLAHLEVASEAAGVELGAYDRRILEWLAGGEVSTAQVVIGLIRRAFQGGRGAQHYYNTFRGQTIMDGDDNISVIMMPSQKGHFEHTDPA